MYRETVYGGSEQNRMGSFFWKKYQVPTNFTIMGAMEWVGYQLRHGCGCRGGKCGACACLYRIDGKKRTSHGCLACQTMVQEGMFVVMLPFFRCQPFGGYSQRWLDSGNYLSALSRSLSLCGVQCLFPGLYPGIESYAHGCHGKAGTLFKMCRGELRMRHV